MGQKLFTRGSQALVIVSIYQGSILGLPYFSPTPPFPRHRLEFDPCSIDFFSSSSLSIASACWLGKELASRLSVACCGEINSCFQKKRHHATVSMCCNRHVLEAIAACVAIAVSKGVLFLKLRQAQVVAFACWRLLRRKYMPLRCFQGLPDCSAHAWRCFFERSQKGHSLEGRPGR